MAAAIAAALAAACGTGQKLCGTVHLGGADSPPVRLDFVQRRCCLWWFSRNELRTVRYSGADGPPLKLEICPETMSLVEFAGLSCGRSAMESGQSAVESRICLETLPSLVDWISEPRTVRQGGPDSPQVGLESVP